MFPATMSEFGWTGQQMCTDTKSIAETPSLQANTLSLPQVESECQFTFDLAGTLAGFGVSSASPNAALKAVILLYLLVLNSVSHPLLCKYACMSHMQEPLLCEARFTSTTAVRI